MNTEKQKVLDMLAQGWINADEAARLLERLDEPGDLASLPADGESRTNRQARGRKLRVQVKGFMEEGKKVDVDVGVPLALARYVDNLVASCLPEAANRELMKQGIDLRRLKIGQLADTLENLDEDIVNADINQEGTDMKVRVYVE
jgi:hypothetical protein